MDGASGGFVAPFVAPDLVWDFRLPRVVSINVSGHKYGLTYPGIGFVVWRSAEHLPDDLVFGLLEDSYELVVDGLPKRERDLVRSRAP